MSQWTVIDNLYQLALAGSREEETRLFNLLIARFEAFARLRGLEREEREEVVQNTLAAIAEKYRDINIKVSFAAWVQRIFENKTADFLRRKGTKRARQEQQLEGETTPGTISIDPSLKRQLLECLNKVNERNKRHARILILRYQGFDFSEICSRLRVNRNNCYSILSRARDMLLNCLKTGDI